MQTSFEKIETWVKVQEWSHWLTELIGIGKRKATCCISIIIESRSTGYVFISHRYDESFAPLILCLQYFYLLFLHILWTKSSNYRAHFGKSYPDDSNKRCSNQTFKYAISSKSSFSFRNIKILGDTIDWSCLPLPYKEYQWLVRF